MSRTRQGSKEAPLCIWVLSSWHRQEVHHRLLREALGDTRELDLESKNLGLGLSCTTYQQVALGKSLRPLDKRQWVE